MATMPHRALVFSAGLRRFDVLYPAVVAAAAAALAFAYAASERFIYFWD
jgi:hypothetical protein